MNDVAVSVKSVSKNFKLPHERRNSLKELRMAGREKTTAKVDEVRVYVEGVAKIRIQGNRFRGVRDGAQVVTEV